MLGGILARMILGARSRSIARWRRRRAIVVLRASGLRGKPQQEREGERRKYSAVLHFHFTRFQEAATLRVRPARDFVLVYSWAGGCCSGF